MFVCRRVGLECRQFTLLLLLREVKIMKQEAWANQMLFEFAESLTPSHPHQYEGDQFPFGMSTIFLIGHRLHCLHNIFFMLLLKKKKKSWQLLLIMILLMKIIILSFDALYANFKNNFKYWECKRIHCCNIFFYQRRAKKNMQPQKMSSCA